MPEKTEKGGVEPVPATAWEEPHYEGGHAGDKPTDEPFSEVPKPYAVPDKDVIEHKIRPKDKPQRSVNGCAIAGLVVVSLVFPVIGVVITIVWAAMPAYRKAAVSALLATLLGSALWAWAIYANNKVTVYDTPVKFLTQYSSAEDWAFESKGNYMPLLELKTKGFLPPDFPESLGSEINLVEHIMGPSGYRVEVTPDAIDVKLYKAQSLWMDQSGTIRIGAADGPEYKASE
jgi:hypothetical protein